MARYNHFSDRKYIQILFSDLKDGDLFRKDFHAAGRRRKDIVCIKTGLLKFREVRSKKEHSVHSFENLKVSSYTELTPNQ